MIRVQSDPFDVAAELALLKANKRMVGATAIFVGSVRERSDGQQLSSLTLEHYPGMTEQALSEIEQDARNRWPVHDTVIIHRSGTMHPGEDIVLVIVTSEHRQAAFAACEFLMDYLKTRAPFWKLETGEAGANWVEAKSSDDQAAARWKN